MFSFLNSIKTNNVINTIRMKKMKIRNHIYHTINDYDYDIYDNYKISSYIQKSETTLNDVKNFIRQIDKTRNLIEILNTMDEDVIQNYLREKKIKKLKDIIKK